jgi:hypothetical protein
MTEETYDIVLGARVSKRLNDKILDVQHGFVKRTGVKPSLNEIVRMLLEKGLEVYERTDVANAKRRAGRGDRY